MHAGLRDLRLVPAAATAWIVAGCLAGMRGAESVAPGLAAVAWLLALAGCVAAAIVPRARAFLPAAVVAALAAAWPATTVALGGVTAYDGVPDWALIAEPLRERFRQLVAELPGEGGELLPGLAIGDEDGVTPALREAMRVTSLSHLTAVSGANCALVVGTVVVGGSVLGVPRGLRILLALGALGAFVILVTPQPSVVRAAVMAAFALVGLAAARPMQGLPLLCLAIASILGAVPAASLELGFVLSVLATAGLLVLSGPIAALAGRVLPPRLATALALPVAAQLAVQPAIALVTPELPTYGVAANLLYVPAAPLATVLGMLACLLAPVLPPVALALAWLGWLPSQWIGSVATVLASLPAARLPWPGGALGVLLHVAVLIAVTVLLLARGPRRLVAGLVVAATVAGYAGALIGVGIAARVDRPGDWSVAMCDVGQGDATLVRSGDAVALIDTGPEPRALADCLRALGIARLDLLVLSHFDRDHVGGTAAVLGRVDTVLAGPADPASTATVLDPLVASGAQLVTGAAGDHGRLGPGAWRVLWPPARGAPPPGNDASLVWRFDPDPGAGSGGAGPCDTGARDASPCDARCCAAAPSIVLLGDLGATAQARLLGRELGGPAVIVKVSHHGSADQHAALYDALAPRIALIGVGRDNDYGHPTASLLGLLRDARALIGRTDQEGLLLVADRDGAPVLWRERGPADRLGRRGRAPAGGPRQAHRGAPRRAPAKVPGAQ